MSDASLPEEERQRGARRRAKSSDARSTRGCGAGLTAAAQLQGMAEKSVRVVCRLRPMSEREKRAGTVPVATASTERREVAVARVLGGGTRQVRSTFGFDDVLTSFSTQEDVFNATLAPLVDEVLAGYEATAFAYGQTGTGKTYTMEGDLETDAGRGLVPRAAAAVIGALASEDFTEYSVTCSYLEIYNEELSDLLSPANQPTVKLDLKDVPSKGVCCMGLSEVPVESVEEILSLVHRAQERRRVAETRINARSSRSHCLFTMRVRCRRVVNGGEMENSGKLHLVDLAGSECAKTASGPAEGGVAGGKAPPATPRGGETDRERKNINQSLLTLGRVITALRDGSGRVPYRDSKLTRLLQDALGGRCKTVVIATISPAMSAVEETISTLTYAEQASGIKNRPVASSLLRAAAQGRPGDASNTNSGCGSSDWAELEMKVVYLTQEVEEAQAALARKYREAQDLASQVTTLGEQLESTETELQSARRSVEEGAFLRARFQEVAEQRGEAALQLSGVLDTALAQAEDLAGLLTERRRWSEESRKQACAVLTAADAGADALAAATAAGVQEVVVQLQAARVAHRAAAEAAGEAVQEQRRLLAEALGGARAGGARLREVLGRASEEARSALQADQDAACGTLSLVEAAISAASAGAVRVLPEAEAAAARGAETFGGRAAAVCEELASARESLQALEQAAARDLGEARRGAVEAREASKARLEADVQQPQAALVQLLEAACRDSDDCLRLVGARRSEDTAAAQDAAGRRLQLQELLGQLRAKQAASVAAGPPRLAAAVQATRAALETHGDAAEEALESLSAGLKEAGGSLAEHTRQSKEGAVAILSGARSRLDAHWESEFATLDAVGASLADAVRLQNDGNATHAAQQAAIDIETVLERELKESVQSLQVWRDNIASQIVELQEQRAAEERALSLLAQQREALQGDVSTIRSTLEQERAELRTCKEELESLRSSQERARKSALESIVSLVTREFDGLGRALGEGLASAGSSASKAQDLSASAARTAAAAEERNSALGHETADVIADWSKAIGIRCGSLSAAQERSIEVEQSIGRSQASAAQCLRDLGGLAAAWGEKCDEVAGKVGVADGLRAECRASAERLLPQWQADLDQAGEAAERWAADSCTRADGALAAAAASARAAGLSLNALRRETETQCDAAATQQAAWESDGAEHGAALVALASRSAEQHQEDGEAEERREQSLAGLEEAAAGISAGAKEAHTASAAVLAAAAAQLQAVPGELRAVEAAFGAAAEALGDHSSKAEAALGNAGEAVEGLRAAQGDVAQAICQSAAAAASAAEAACADGAGAARKHSESLAAAAERAKGCWRRAEESCQEALAEVDAAADSVGEAAAAAAQAGSERILTELESGCKSQTRAASGAEALGSRTSEALEQHKAALRQGLSATPFEALADTQDESLPTPPCRPVVELSQLPTEEQLLEEFHGKVGKRPAAMGEQRARENQENILEGGIAGKKQAAAGKQEILRSVLSEANRLE